MPAGVWVSPPVLSHEVPPAQRAGAVFPPGPFGHHCPGPSCLGQPMQRACLLCWRPAGSQICPRGAAVPPAPSPLRLCGRFGRVFSLDGPRRAAPGALFLRDILSTYELGNYSFLGAGGGGGKTSTGCLSSSSQPTCQTEETLPETLVFMYPLRASSSPNFSVATHCSSLTKKSPGGTVPHTTHRACTQ